MLLKSLLLFTSAILASASSGPEDPPKPPSTPPKEPAVPGIPVCPECQPCAVDCLCPTTHIASCMTKPPHPKPKDPLGRPVCPENQPCVFNSCICPRALAGPPKTPSHGGGNQPAVNLPHQPHNPNGWRVCPEGQPCSRDCLCSLGNVLSFLNPSDLKDTTTICDVGQVNSSCISRDALVESLKDVLFPPAGTHVIDLSGGDTDAKDAKDEL